MTGSAVPSRPITAALWLSLLALAASVSLQNIRSYDYWWHLRTGQLIADLGSVPRADPYTYTAPGAPWLDSHWLHQVGLHLVHSLGGHAGVVAAKLLLVAALLGSLATIGYRRRRPAVTVAGLALALLVVCDRVMPRPELATFALLAGVLALLDRFRRLGDRWVYAVIPIQMVWVNVHGLWVLGVAACAISLVAEILRPLSDPGEALRVARVRRLAALTLLAALASLANPYLLEGALYPIHFLGMIGPPQERDALGALISELASLLDARHPLPPLAVGLVMGLAAASLAAMALNWRRLPGSDPILWGAFLHLAIAAQRNRALFAIVAAPILVRNANDLLDAHPIRISRRAGSVGAALVSLLVLAIAADIWRGGFFASLAGERESGFGIEELLYPEGAAEWIAREKPPGPIAHHMADGGYLIWRLYPEYRVMLDGRLEVFGAEKLIDLSYLRPPGFQRLDAKYGFGVVLVHYSRFPSDELLWWLYRHQSWQLAFVDDVAAVFVRRRGQSPPAAAAANLDDPALFPPLGGAPSASDLRRRTARASFLSAVHRYAQALELWEETVALYPDHPDGALRLAALLYGTGSIAQGDAILDALLEERPGDAPLHKRAGDLRLAAGRRREAKELYDAALAIDPDLESALYPRARLAREEGDAATERELYRRLLAIVPPADPVVVEIRRRMRALEGRGDPPAPPSPHTSPPRPSPPAPPSPW